jgi:microcystin degradation protein MlrC
MRIAIGGILHETSTFVQTTTTLSDFQHASGIARGQELIERFRGTNVCSGGFVDRLEEEDGVEIVPLLRASAFPGGLIDAADYADLKHELLDRLVEAQRVGGPVDGVLLDLHGAMVVDGIDDADGDMTAAVREAVGPERPVVVTYDLHGNHTSLRVKSATAVVGFDTFPHVDMSERGREAAEVILATIRGEMAPVGAIRNLPMFWATRKQVTAHPPMDDVIRRVHKIEERPGIICMTIATGFAWSDVPDVGSSVIVVADGDEELAQATADEFGEWVWENRQTWFSAPVAVRDALDAGHAFGQFPIMLADHCDNTGGGSPGDSTEVLRTFLELELKDALILYLVDSEAAALAHATGVGHSIDVSLGGRSDPVQGPPVDCTAEVVAVTSGEFAYDGPMLAGLTGTMGPSAWLRVEGVNVVVVTAREQPYDMAFSRTLGIDCSKMKYICVKSAAHLRAAFEPTAGSIHNVDAAGIHTHRFEDLVFEKNGRDMFPVEIPPE